MLNATAVASYSTPQSLNSAATSLNGHLDCTSNIRASKTYKNAIKICSNFLLWFPLGRALTKVNFFYKWISLFIAIWSSVVHNKLHKSFTSKKATLLSV